MTPNSRARGKAKAEDKEEVNLPEARAEAKEIEEIVPLKTDLIGQRKARRKAPRPRAKVRTRAKVRMTDLF